MRKFASSLPLAVVAALAAISLVQCSNSSSGSPTPALFQPPANRQLSPATSSSASPSGYVGVVLSDHPYQFFELTESSGTTAADEAGGPTGSYFGSYQLGITPGPLAGISQGTLRCLGGATSQCVSLPTANWVPGTSYTLEAWVRTSLPTSGYMTVWGSG